MSQDNVYFFGIRHHGPGSARSLVQALNRLEPEVLLVEGPPEAGELLPLAGHEDMRPPVAILLHRADDPSRAVFYPFAEFSPEWQAMRHAREHDIPLHFMDLPQAHQLAFDRETELDPADGDESVADPLGAFARAAGFEDGERWWDYLVEQRGGGEEVFQAIAEAMQTLREAEPTAGNWRARREALREAWMRGSLRAAQKQGFQKIAVVCGAWHVPALKRRVTVKEDTALLKGLPKCKIQATWVPWSYPRLTWRGGYGAGIGAPGWYEHLWRTDDAPGQRARRITTGWLTRIANHLREQGLDAATASVIEAARLAESLAALRGKPLPDLGELEEAALSTLCFGEITALRLIRERLSVGDRLGEVPADTPMIPLQRDLSAQQKRLRLPPSAVEQDKVLDLRRDTDLARSHLLHRLNLLDIPWGRLQSSRSKGTFKETWFLQWQPELTLRLIEAGIWGMTVEEAAQNRARDSLNKAERLAEVAALLQTLLLADLMESVEVAVQRLADMAALAADAAQLMDALPSLAEVSRYGNARRFDPQRLAQILDALVVRVCVGLSPACASLDDQAAAEMFQRIKRTTEAIHLPQNPQHLEQWQAALKSLLDREETHNLLTGYCCRLLLDANALSSTRAGDYLSRALSPVNDPAHAAAWLEGFLHGGGLLLLHDDNLWQILDTWVTQLDGARFIEILPLLRRTFAEFSSGERRQLGERVKSGSTDQPARVPVPFSSPNSLDAEFAARALPLTMRLLGLKATAGK